MNTPILKKIITFIIIAIIIIIILFVPMFPRLILNSVKNDKIDMILKIPKKEFIISYIHSVNKSKIRDYYNINKDKDIVLEKTRFVSYGAGVPEPKEGQTFLITDDYMEIDNINMIIKDLYLSIGTSANHSLMIDDKIFELNKTFNPQTIIKIEYKNVNLFYYIKSYITAQ